MLDKETMIEVTNRFSGSIGYTVPDLGINRHYEPGETKTISYDELLKLSYYIGCKNLLKDCIIIHNKEAVAELLGEVEPEYYYTDQDVKTLLTSGSLAQLEDCLDFAEDGVIDLVKKYAVELNLNDVAKRQAILRKTGFNVTNAIAINKIDHADIDGETPAVSKRRAAPISHAEATKPARRTAPPQYKVVSESVAAESVVSKS